MAFKFVVLAAFVAVANAGLLPAAPIAAPLAYAAPIAKQVITKVSDAEYDPNPQYAYSYDVADSLTGDFKAQHETRNGDVVQGSYSLLEADGTRRVVDYAADPLNGFNAVVRKEPATLAVKAAIPAAPVAVAAPIAAAPIAKAVVAAPAAPLAVAAPIAAAAPIAKVAAPAALPVAAYSSPYLAAAPAALPAAYSAQYSPYLAATRFAAPLPAAYPSFYSSYSTLGSPLLASYPTTITKTFL